MDFYTFRKTFRDNQSTKDTLKKIRHLYTNGAILTPTTLQCVAHSNSPIGIVVFTAIRFFFNY